MFKLGIIRRKECWALTGRGWIAALLCAVTVAVLAVRSAFPFLAVSQPLPGEVLVVEGWLPDYLINDVRSEFVKGGYTLLVTTGGPIQKGEIFAEFKTSAEMTRSILLNSGFEGKKVIAVPHSEQFRDRTYASALALKKWLQESGSTVKSVNVFSRGAHARRTRLLFEAALDGQCQVGIIAGQELRYDGRRWWKTSEGVRDLIDEAVAYLYARFLFHPR